MKTVFPKRKNLFSNRKKSNQKGQTLIEYLVLVAIIGIGSMVMVRSVGQNVNVRFAKVVKALGGSVEGSMQADRVSQSAYGKKDMGTFLQGARGNSKKNDSEEN